MIDQTAKRLHQDSIVIDAVCPLVMDDPRYLEWYREGGVTALAPTVGGWDSAGSVQNRIASWHRLLRERDDLLLVRQAADIEQAKRSSRLGIYFHLQGTDPIEDTLDFVELYKQLGVGMVQLTYNVRNRVGDGCEERADAGLSRFGRELIQRLNAARVIIDCSHTGFRTSIEAIECSSMPVVLSHSNSAAIQPSPRNVSRELIAAIAGSGGAIGVAGFPAMVARTKTPILNDFIAHIDWIVQQVGIDHVALGIDYYWGQSGVASDEEAAKSYDEAIRAGRWSAAYPPPPHHYPAEIKTPKSLANLTARLLQRGYRDVDVQKILGGNWLRVMRAVWG